MMLDEAYIRTRLRDALRGAHGQARNLVRGKHTTLLITSHYYTELDNLATKILYLKTTTGSKSFLESTAEMPQIFEGYGKRA